jgi:serine O-acetyltransferase
VYIMHGQVVIDGLVRIGTQTAIAPWVTLGRRGAPLEGPTVQKGVMIGTGAKLLGPIKVGFRSSVGANAVVIEDVPPCTSVAGVPAKIVADRRETDVEFQIIREAMRAKQAQARGNGEGNGGGGGSEPH